ncbi:MAG: hypothetical protein JNJ73_19535 [Hyphomonadaceae bacterium]|nr:hypothetical protein [Hyphomonadaceae bacterium]
MAKTRNLKPDGARLEDWIEPMTLRGRWGRVDSSNKSFVDRGTVEDIAPAFAAEFSMVLENVREGADPPDVLARLDGRDVGIELVEFLNETVREREAMKLPITFEDRLWSKEATIAKLNALLDKKNALYARRPDGFAADILVIHSCEMWLNKADVETWVSQVTFEPRSAIRAAYFALERLPDSPKPHWPLFRLYGP